RGRSGSATRSICRSECARPESFVLASESSIKRGGIRVRVWETHQLFTGRRMGVSTPPGGTALSVLAPGGHLLGRLDDGEEVVGLEAGAPDQGAVDVGAAEQGDGIVRFDAPPILDDDSRGGR